MTLVNTRAAFEKAITDAVKDVDPTVTMVYDNVAYTKPGATVKYIVTTVNFGQATRQLLRGDVSIADAGIKAFGGIPSQIFSGATRFLDPLNSAFGLIRGEKI